MKFLGGLAIFIFLCGLIIPNIILYRLGKFKTFNNILLSIYILLNLLFVGMLIYKYIKGKKCTKNNCNENFEIGEYNSEKRVYELFNKGGFKNFQMWYASIAHDVWMDILISILFFLVPYPFLPKTHKDRLLLFLSKIGLYKISLALFIGNPKYIIKKHKSVFNNYKPIEKVEFIVSTLFLSFIVLLIIFSLFNIDFK